VYLGRHQPGKAGKKKTKGKGRGAEAQQQRGEEGSQGKITKKGAIAGEKGSLPSKGENMWKKLNKNPPTRQSNKQTGKRGREPSSKGRGKPAIL